MMKKKLECTNLVGGLLLDWLINSMFVADLFCLRRPIKSLKIYQKHPKLNSTIYFDTISKPYNLLHDIEKEPMYNIHIHIY